MARTVMGSAAVRVTAEVVGWWAVLTGLWLVLISHVDLLEWVVGSCERIRPAAAYAFADAAGEAAYVLLGTAGLLAGSAFLANFLPYGTFNTLSSGGTVPLLNAAIGVEVAGAVVVLLARFLDQALEIEDGGAGGTGRQDEEANRS